MCEAGGGGACTFVHISSTHFELFNRMKDGSYKGLEVCRVELAEGELRGADVLTTTGAGLWYEQGEQSSLVIRINSLAAERQGFKRYRQSHAVFQSKGSKAEVNSTWTEAVSTV